MTSPHSGVFETIGKVAPTRADSLARMEMLAHLMDTAFVLPGTKQRVGFDALIGLIPGVGDALTTLVSAYIVWEARRLGLPKRKIARMVMNVGLDSLVGVVPVVGDAFDVFFRANRRNMKIVRDHLGLKEGKFPGTIDGEARRL